VDHPPVTDEGTAGDLRPRKAEVDALAATSRTTSRSSAPESGKWWVVVADARAGLDVTANLTISP
jgi:hypothetical protein